MDKLIIGIAVIWGGLWLLGVVLRVAGEFLTAVRQQWHRSRPGRERVGYVVGRPVGVLVATLRDHRLMSSGLAFSLAIGAVALAALDSRWLVASLDGMFGGATPLLGWAAVGLVIGIAMSVASRVLELGWLGPLSASRVPDISRLREAEAAESRYFRTRQVGAVVAVGILIVSLWMCFERVSEYQRWATLDQKKVAIEAAAVSGNVAALNAALEDAAGSMSSDPKSSVGILAALREWEGSRSEVAALARIAAKYLDAFRDDTEKAVTDGKPEALVRSEAFSQVDRVASLKWLGRLYAAGRGGANRDLVKAFSLYAEAASVGDKDAATMQENLAQTMVSAKEDSVRQVAFEYLEPKAQPGRPADHFWLGQWYAGSGKPGDQKLAEKWLVKALSQEADANIRDRAFVSLSNLKDVGSAATKALDDRAPSYVKGSDERMKRLAYAYLERRAEADDPGAMLWMGFRYAEGDGIAKDASKARDWYLKAALQNKNVTVKDKAFEALGAARRVRSQEVEAIGAGRVAESVSSDISVYQSPAPAPTTLAPALPSYQAPQLQPQAAFPSTRRSDSIPTNASLNAYDAGWTCNRGYRRGGSECVAIQIPQNASLDYSGHDWTCNRGYRRAGSECVAIQIPQNASLDYSGHDWACNKGFVRQGNECVVK